MNKHWPHPKFATQICETLARADALCSELLSQIEGLMGAEEGTPEAARLIRLSNLVYAYEECRVSLDDKSECRHVPVRAALDDSIGCIRCGVLLKMPGDEE